MRQMLQRVSPQYHTTGANKPLPAKPRYHVLAQKMRVLILIRLPGPKRSNPLKVTGKRRVKYFENLVLLRTSRLSPSASTDYCRFISSPDRFPISSEEVSSRFGR